MKRTALKRTGGLKRSPIKSKPPKPKPVPVEFSDDVKRMVYLGAQGRCAARIAGCRERIEHFHHRRMRSAGGTGTLENCWPVCSSCHRWIHDHPGWAYRHGMLVRRHADPTEVVPVLGCSPKCEDLHVCQ